MNHDCGLALPEGPELCFRGYSHKRAFTQYVDKVRPHDLPGWSACYVLAAVARETIRQYVGTEPGMIRFDQILRNVKGMSPGEVGLVKLSAALWGGPPADIHSCLAHLDLTCLKVTVAGIRWRYEWLQMD